MAACIHMLSLRVCVGRLSSGLRKTLKGPLCDAFLMNRRTDWKVTAGGEPARGHVNAHICL